MFGRNIKIAGKFSIDKHAVFFQRSCLDLVKDIPDKSMQLIVSFFPYNTGKEYEKNLKLKHISTNKQK